MGSQIPDPDVVCVGKAARYINVGEKTMRQYADKGLIPSVRDPLGNRIFKHSDLIRFLAKQAKDATRAARKRRKALDKLRRRLERGEITAKQEREAARRIKARS